MAYTNPFHIANGLTLDFTVSGATTATDAILGLSSTGEVTKFTSIPASRIGTGSNLTEATSAVLTITGGTGAVLSGVTIQVKAASGSQAGYLASADWTTFNNKLTSTLTSANIFVGNGSNVATGVAMSGDIAITNAGVTSIGAGKIVNAQVNASAAIAHTKLAALTASLVMATDGSGFGTTVAGFTTTIAGYLTTISSNVQSQLTNNIIGKSAAGIATSAATTGYAIVWNEASNQWTLGPVGGGGSVTGPGASTSTALVRWNGTGGTSLSNSGVLLDGSNNMTGVNSLVVTTTATVANSGFHTTDTSGSFYMALAVGSAYTAARTLTLTTGDSARTITLSGNPTLADWFDQSVKTTASPIFVSAQASNAGGLRVLDASSGFYMLLTTSSIYTANRTLTLVTGDVARTLTINASGTLYVTGGTDVAIADGGTGVSLADPGANRLLGWDTTDGFMGFFTLGTGLTYTHATHTLSSTGSGGDVVGPASSIDNAIALYNSTTGKLLKDNGVSSISAAGIYSTTGTKTLIMECIVLDRGIASTSSNSVIGGLTLANGDSATIVITVAGKDDSSNTGFGGIYTVTWTRSGGALVKSGESGAALSNINTGGTATISTADTGDTVSITATLTIGGGTGNASWAWTAKVIKYVA